MISLILALLTASPANVQAQIGAARCGDTVALAGSFPAKIAIKSRPTCAATLDLTGATINWLFFQGASNWTVKGGEFTGAPYEEIQIEGSDHLVFDRPWLHDYGTAGFSIGTSSQIDIDDASCAHTGGDCVDIGSSQFVTIHRLKAFDLHYSLALHSDVVQIWSVAGQPISSDIAIDHAMAACHCQGFDSFGNGSGLPVKNISLTDSVIATDQVWAANFTGCTGACVMTNNRAETLFGQQHGWGGAQFVMTAAPGATVTLSGNSNGAAP